MKVKCPACGAVASLDALIGHDGAREAVLAALQMPAPLAKVLIQYVGLFRPATRELSFDRLAKLLGELLPDVNAQRIERGGQVFDAPIEAWIEALGQVLAARESGRLKVPLKTHGYLYEVLAGTRVSSTSVMTAEPATAPRQMGKVAAGLAALEQFKHG
ncbi:hypothetical protein HUS70_03245 [Pandoraea nosoerga]|uniref:DUF2752 domain-containing protein n=1 Tax=Pandoraea nosoerga TaxID=2508296 RepID=A0A5E4T8L3_9BURK|nr:hypothetical protein [Pandoraea nosoerga]MBN4664215.1 hypothetical protein [Pandoraea nosoerga]MBN4675376.1 hypothetical protein [Pandoraea nosoerga]MBN4679302.1 hypothetical protein [Pandoraea nosoerga]MBN4743700.1 hypothetical protein [Pandoraea nosoerga]VVD84107.1 hypothetical protein PNO31109_01258 [Pandoraea nosoerga]